jgi:hypothetical protein
MVDLTGERCATCRFWESGRTECRRYPPQVVMVYDEDGKGGIDSTTGYWWPETNFDAWCGEYQPAPREETP